MRTRSAVLLDAPAIHALIVPYAQAGTLLPRSLPEISENVRDFMVVEHRGQVVACGALHFYGLHLAEIRSVAVDLRFQKRGAGRRVVEALLRESERHGLRCVCLFTRIPEFFARMGFVVAARDDLPDKAYKDCLGCPKRHACDEVPMVRGELPAVRALPRIFQAAALDIQR